MRDERGRPAGEGDLVASRAGGAHLPPAPGQGAREHERQPGRGEPVAGLEPDHRRCPARAHGSGHAPGRPVHAPPRTSAPSNAASTTWRRSWYVTLFGERPVRVIDEDPWGTDLTGDLRLVGPGGHRVHRRRPARRRSGCWRSAPARPAADARDSPAVRFALAAPPGLVGGPTVRVCVADLVLGSLAEAVIDVAVGARRARRLARRRGSR